MQITALNTIIAAQQARAAAPTRPAPSETAKPAAAEQTSAFAPLEFSSAAAPDRPAAPAPSAGAPLGSQVDIRV